jgi:hypothetical protein
MFYWDGPLLTREQIIEKRRLRLRRQLLAMDCLTELLPLLNKLPEVGDYSVLIGGDFDDMRQRVTEFVRRHWADDEAGKEVLECLDRWSKKKTLPVRARLVLCEEIPSDE